jgi:hypothetical protein
LTSLIPARIVGWLVLGQNGFLVRRGSGKGAYFVTIHSYCVEAYAWRKRYTLLWVMLNQYTVLDVAWWHRVSGGVILARLEKVSKVIEPFKVFFSVKHCVTGNTGMCTGSAAFINFFAMLIGACSSFAILGPKFIRVFYNIGYEVT